VTDVQTGQGDPTRVMRLAVPADREPVIGFCRHTWGAEPDYIEQVIDRWLGGGDGVLAVAEVGGRAAACCYIRFMSPREAFLAGMRVDPDHRRAGLSIDLTRFCVAHAARQGRTTVRLIVGWNNQPALAAVARCGFEAVGRMTHWSRAVDRSAAEIPVPRAIGRAPAPPAGALWAVGWSVREITPGDVAERWSAGWALGGDGGLALLRPGEDHLWLAWLDGTAAGRATLARAALAATARAGLGRCRVLLGNDPLTHRALEAAGFERGLEYHVFEQRHA
jgi:RimJ/RimL family protein N-acetyltransferase